MSLQPRSHHSKRHGGESNPKTIVGLQKSEVQMKKMMDTLDRQQHTAVNNIANHQQAMKMSWRRLEERRSASPLLSRNDTKKGEAKNSTRGLMLHSNTKLYVNKSPEIYNTTTTTEQAKLDRVITESADDSLIGNRSQGFIVRNKTPVGPPPTQLTRTWTASPYISSPYNFRRGSGVPGAVGRTVDSKGSATNLSETKLSDSRDQEVSSEMASSASQPMLLQSGINSKETLLRASTLMDMSSSSSGPSGFKGFYSFYSKDRPRSRTIGSITLDSDQLAESIASQSTADFKEEESNEVLSLAEQFEQIRKCRYIRHYYPDGTALEEL